MDNNVKEKILDATNKIISEKGLSSFTLDEVAKEAGISKGGLLYHYPSKDKLMAGLIENYMKVIDSMISKSDDNSSNESMADWFISYVREQLNQTIINSNIANGILAAVALNPELLKPVLESRKQMYARQIKSKDPILTLILGFACDGIVFSNLLGIDVIPAETKIELEKRLVSLLEENC